MAGDLASGSFYVPNRGVKLWAWETYWLVGGISGWILAPWLLALVMTRDLIGVLHEAPASSIFCGHTFGLPAGSTVIIG
jgi:L-rhamnose-H+ transport protein